MTGQARTFVRRWAAELVAGALALVAIAATANIVRETLVGAAAAVTIGGIIYATHLALQSMAASIPPKFQRSIEYLRGMAPHAFEHKTAQMLVHAGFTHVEVVGGRSDYGVDVLGIAPNGMLAAVQCKRYAHGNNVTSSEMQLFVGMAQVHYGADALIYVTTSDYTRDAREFGEYHGVVLVDGDGVVNGICDEAFYAGLLHHAH